MELKLVFPSEKYERQWYDIVNEFESSKEKVAPYSLSFRQNDFSEFLKRTREAVKEINMEYNHPSITYFLMDDKEEKILGAVNIRQHLDDEFLLRNGHIGYGVHPLERRKGYASKMLAMALQKCKELGLYKVLVTCNYDNIGSARR